MSVTGDIWEKLGEIEEHDCPHILNQLFAHYEALLHDKKAKADASYFFSSLNRIIDDVTSCNVNRR